MVRRDLGHELKIYNTAPQIANRLSAGEVFDILVSPPPATMGVAEAAQAFGFC